MPDQNGPGGNQTEPRRFISEKIVKQPRSGKEKFMRALALLLTAALFGVVAAVTFVVSKPWAERYLTKETTSEQAMVTIPKDDPESLPEETSTSAPTAMTETEPIEEVFKSAMEKYNFSMDDLNTLYGNLRTIAQKADKGIVTVHSVKTQTDWFNNPVENTGLYAGAIISSANGEMLILTPEQAVEDADSIRVAFSDGTEVQGTIREMDSLSGMAIVSIPTADLSRLVIDEAKPIVLGNSYSVKQGDFVMAIGGPAGMVHSTGYGFVSYIARNVQITDGMTRIIYADLKSNASTGTFLINTAGQIIGWVTDEYDKEASEGLTIAMAISDYKSILEEMSNGRSYPYFGIKGQEVSAAMNESGMPLGVYVVDVNADSPAYEAGIQCGDIIVGFDGEDIVTMKDFQVKLESLKPEAAVAVTVLRSGRDEYKALEYPVTIGAR